ncbi:MAG: hypothetical protein Q9188_004749 [Gyalolechia gomerana]
MKPSSNASANSTRVNQRSASHTATPDIRGEAAGAPETGDEVSYIWPNGKRERAIKHENIRTQLLQKAEAMCSWVHPQPHGHAADDRTAPVSFPLDQLSWGFKDRANYPPINFVLNRQGYTHPTYDVLHWYYNGLLVLDLENKPVKDFLHLPPTVSSKIPGGHIEALLRFDDRTTFADIRARMPPRILSCRNGKTTERPLKKLGALSAATARYREMAGCLNWHDRMGSQVLNDYILANLPEELRAQNTTQGWRNLTKDEITAIRAPAIGSRPQQARKRASSAEVWEKREKSIKKRKQKAEAVGVKFGRDQLSLTPVVGNEGVDMRKKAPCGEHELESLRRALRPTLQQVIGIIGVEPVKCDRLSYDDQLRHLQYQVAHTHRTLNREDEDLPKLIQLTKWCGSIRNWRSAKFWDGTTLYEIDEQGGVGAKILDIDDPEIAGNAPAISHDGGDGDTEHEDPPAREGESFREIAPPEIDILKGQRANEAQSEYTSDIDSDDEAPAGSYLVDARGNRIDPDTYPNNDDSNSV